MFKVVEKYTEYRPGISKPGINTDIQVKIKPSNFEEYLIEIHPIHNQNNLFNNPRFVGYSIGIFKKASEDEFYKPLKKMRIPVKRKDKKDLLKYFSKILEIHDKLVDTFIEEKKIPDLEEITLEFFQKKQINLCI